MYLEVMLVAIALGVDSFSVSVGLGCQKKDEKRTWIFTAFVGFLHIVLPLLGFFLGQTAGFFLGEIAEYLGAGVLVFLGIKILGETYRGEEITDCGLSGWSLFLIPVSVSIDALTVGFGLGTFGLGSFTAAILFGFVAILLTRLGFLLGEKVGRALPHTEYLAGIILIGLGVMVLL